MKITALVENVAPAPLQAVHGLSLYIETACHKILFDLGTNGALLPNAKALGIDLTAVDTVIISHGHYDHGGDLPFFLEVNHTATIYLQRSAFEGHYAKHPLITTKKYIGLDVNLKNHPQVVLVDGDLVIDDELTLFRADSTARLHSTANDTLYDEVGMDRFFHEQNLILHEGGRTALIMGCGHSGVVNILDKAKRWNPEICVGGYHLYNPTSKISVDDGLLEDISLEMSQYPIRFYTCHCTGEYAFDYLAQRIPHMDYFSCGKVISL